MELTSQKITLLYDYFCNNGVFGIDEQYYTKDDHADVARFKPIFDFLQKNKNNDVKLDESYRSLLLDYLASNGYLAKETNDLTEEDYSDPNYTKMCEIYDELYEYNKCKHQLDDKFKMSDTCTERGYYYGECMYCIMEGKIWYEEWDSWGEIAFRVVQEIVKAGFEDYKLGICDFLQTSNIPKKCRDLDINKDILNNAQNKCACERQDFCHNIEDRTKTFRNLYNIGIQLAIHSKSKKFPKNIY